MPDFNYSLGVDLKGNLDRRARQMGASSEKLARRHNRAMTGMQAVTRRAFSSMRQAADRSAKYLAAGAVAGTVLATKHIVDFDERIRQLGVNAGKSGVELDAFTDRAKDKIQQAAQEFKISRDAITDALDKMITNTGDFEVAENNIYNLAAAMRATAADGASLGGVLGELQKKGIDSAGEVERVFDLLTAQGKMGAFTFKDFGTEGEKIFATYAPKNEHEIAEMGAVAQFTRRSVSSAAETATAINSFISEINDPAKQKLLRDKAGIDVKDYDSIPNLIVDLIKASGGDRSRLGTVFGQESIKVLLDAMNLHTSGGDVRAEFDRFINVDSKGVVATDAADMSKTAKAQTRGATEAIKAALDKKLSQPIQDFAAAISELETGKLDDLLTQAGYLAGGFAGLYALIKTYQGGKWIASMFTGTDGLASDIASQLGDAVKLDIADPLPVVIRKPKAGANQNSREKNEAAANNGNGSKRGKKKSGKKKPGKGLAVAPGTEASVTSSGSQISTGGDGRLLSKAPGAFDGFEKLSPNTRSASPEALRAILGEYFPPLLMGWDLGSRVAEWTEETIVGRGVDQTLAFLGSDHARRQVQARAKQQAHDAAIDRYVASLNERGGASNLSGLYVRSQQSGTRLGSDTVALSRGHARFLYQTPEDRARDMKMTPLVDVVQPPRTEFTPVVDINRPASQRVTPLFDIAQPPPVKLGPLVDVNQGQVKPKHAPFARRSFAQDRAQMMALTDKHLRDVQSPSAQVTNIDNSETIVGAKEGKQQGGEIAVKVEVNHTHQTAQVSTKARGRGGLYMRTYNTAREVHQ